MSAATFIVVKPDILIRGLLRSFLDELASLNFRAELFRFKRCTMENLRLSNGGGQFKWEFDDWELNARSYDFGPALGLIVTRDGCVSADDLHEYLRRAKGSALPRQWSTGSLRAKFGVNRVFNSIHVPNSQMQANLEARLWFGQGLDETIKVDGSEFESISNEYDSHGYFLARCDGGDILSKISNRIAHAMSFSSRTELQLKVPPDGPADANFFGEGAADSVLAALREPRAMSGPALAGLWYVCEEHQVYYSAFERYCLDVHYRYLSTTLASD